MSAASPLAAARRDAQLRRDSGDLAGAIATLTDVLERVRPAFGADHPEVLATAHQLSRLHRDAGEPARARGVLEEALAAGQRRFGDDDPLLLAISFDLGVVAEELGNRHEARRNFGRVASAGPATLGPDHWTVRAAREYLGEEPPTAVVTTPTGPQPAMPAEPPTTLLTAPVSPPPTRAGTAHVQRAPAFAPPPAHAVPPPAHAAPPPTHAPSPAYAAQPPAYAAQPPAYAAPAVPAVFPGSAPPAPDSGGSGRRGTAIAAGIAAVAAVTAAVLAAVAVLGDGRAGPGGSAAPTTPPVSISGDPPTDVRVARDGDAMVLTWKDPAPGRVSFVITGGKDGEELRFVGQLPSGSPPRFPVYGFRADVNYCFQIAAVYSTTELGVAQPVCTTGREASPTG